MSEYPCLYCHEPVENGAIHECRALLGRRVYEAVEPKWRVTVSHVRGVVTGEHSVRLQINDDPARAITPDDAVATAKLLLNAARAASEAEIAERGKR